MVRRMRTKLAGGRLAWERFAAAMLWLSIAGVGVGAESETGLPAAVTQFLTAHCVHCHGADKPKAGLGIDRLLKLAAVDSDLSAWQEILGRLEARDMPPQGSPRPTDAEYEVAVAAIRKDVERVEETLLAQRPRAMRRLNRAEYANTVRDLFGIRFRPGDDFPADGALHGFNTVADGLTLSPALVAKYLATAHAVLDRAFRSSDANHKPPTNRSAFYEEHYAYPQGTPLGGFGVYNGNAHLTFGPEGKRRVVYIGGPSSAGLMYWTDSFTDRPHRRRPTSEP